MAMHLHFGRAEPVGPPYDHTFQECPEMDDAPPALALGIGLEPGSMHRQLMLMLMAA